MKVISGGGGIDADGNWYELPTIVREVEDDAFERAIKALAKSCAPTTIMVSRAFAEALRDNEDGL